eukprot:gene11897-5303_t
MNKESIKRRQNLDDRKQKKRMNKETSTVNNNISKTNHNSITNTKHTQVYNDEEDVEYKELESLIKSEIGNLKKKINENMESVDKLENQLEKFMKYKSKNVQKKESFVETNTSPFKFQEPKNTKDDHVLLKKIEELEIQVQKLTIEKEMWRYKMECSSNEGGGNKMI